MQLRTLSSDFRRFRPFPTDFGRDRVVFYVIVQFRTLLSDLGRFHLTSKAIRLASDFGCCTTILDASVCFRSDLSDFGRYTSKEIEVVIG